ncbi:FeoA domain-containing protein [uncultured Ruminococcus sp.]|uniref:FeoA family protein n=1 Tax=uncultured Ruminococcus sp. TaxID=165186 RepID=UPI00263437A8|nr:FeoA domain-containing protein [uncultured Ruminococcus sp.]
MQNPETVRPLCALQRGETAVIEALYLHGAMRHRLQDLGWIPGTRIQRLQTAGSGDPTAYAVRGAVIALRRCDAKLVLVYPTTSVK